jgi:pimeloyl-ACP methyl ester carboxylesterase
MPLIGRALALLISISIVSPTARGAETQDHFAGAPGARVHYVTAGSGARTVVLIHGWSCNLTFWDAQIDPLAAKHRVIAIDLPGHGKSDAPAVAYTPQRMADGVATVLQQERVSDPVLVGHSMGALVARYVVDRVPRTRAIVLVDSRSVLGSIDATERRRVAQSLRASNSDAAMRALLDRFFTAATPSDVRTTVVAAMMATPRAVAASAYEEMAIDSRWTVSPLKVPTLAIYGQFAGDDTEYALRRVFATLEYVRWQGVGHFLMMERPADFNDAVSAFLARLR